MIVVEPTNSLLVNATAEQHIEIVEIISYVDAETDEQDIPYKVYPLENQSPSHLVEVLEPLIQESVLDKEGKVGRLYGVSGIPQTVIIGKDGTVQVVHAGFSRDLKQRLKAELDALVAGEVLAPGAGGGEEE